MTDKTTAELRKLAQEVIAADNVVHTNFHASEMRLFHAASAAPTLARYVLQSLDAPGTRLTEDERKFIENVRSGNFIEDRDATIQLQLKIITRLSAQPKETRKVRTPGTVEVCERNALKLCADYPSRHARPTDCRVYACPLKSAPEKAEGETP